MISNNKILLIFTNVPGETLNFPSGSKGKLISHENTHCWGLEYTGLLSDPLGKLGFCEKNLRKLYEILFFET